MALCDPAASPSKSRPPRPFPPYFSRLAWRDSQLVVLEQQLAGIRLMPSVVEGLRSQQAFLSRTFETTSPSEFRKAFSPSNPAGLLMTYSPRGWLYQNMVVHARAMQNYFDLFDLANETVLPHREEEILRAIEKATARFSPFTWMAAIGMPNLVKAAQVMAQTQTKADLTMIVCALERHRLAHGEYPETLESLVPRFAEELPHDIITGQPMKYRRSDSGFLLYSVGWNGQGDGGEIATSAKSGDWVWNPGE